MFGSGFDPRATPSLQPIHGRWELTPAQGAPLVINIDASGTITGTAGACNFYDSAIVPRKDRNVFSVHLKFNGPMGCGEPYGVSDTLNGFAVAYALKDGRTQLVMGAWHGWDPVWLAASGRR